MKEHGTKLMDQMFFRTVWTCLQYGVFRRVLALDTQWCLTTSSTDSENFRYEYFEYARGFDLRYKSETVSKSLKRRVQSLWEGLLVSQ